jgi:arylsulfatase A-like enzyme
VLVVLIDDAGFGAASPFGGPVNTPRRSGWPRGG